MNVAAREGSLSGCNGLQAAWPADVQPVGTQ